VLGIYQSLGVMTGKRSTAQYYLLRHTILNYSINRVFERARIPDRVQATYRELKDSIENA
jgi:hypothetical protein